MRRLAASTGCANPAKKSISVGAIRLIRTSTPVGRRRARSMQQCLSTKNLTHPTLGEAAQDFAQAAGQYKKSTGPTL